MDGLRSYPVTINEYILPTHNDWNSKRMGNDWYQTDRQGLVIKSKFDFDRIPYAVTVGMRTIFSTPVLCRTITHTIWHI